MKTCVIVKTCKITRGNTLANRTRSSMRLPACKENLPLLPVVDACQNIMWTCIIGSFHLIRSSPLSYESLSVGEQTNRNVQNPINEAVELIRTAHN